MSRRRDWSPTGILVPCGRVKLYRRTVPAESRPEKVIVRISGQQGERKESFPTKTAAKAYFTRLTAAIGKGEDFDAGSFAPVSWGAPTAAPGARVNNRRPATGAADTAGDGRGRQNVVIFQRSWAEGTAADGSRLGWSKQPCNPKLFVQATVNLAELAGDTAARLVEAVESRVLGSYDLAPVVLPAQRTAAEPLEARLAALQRDHDAAQTEASDHRRKAKALRETAVEFRAAGNREQFEQYNDLAVQRDAQERAAEERCAHLAARMKQLSAEAAAPAPAPVEDALVNLSPAAYVAETLRRAALNNGTVPDRAADYCEDTLTGWTFTPAGPRVQWSYAARLPCSTAASSNCA